MLGAGQHAGVAGQGLGGGQVAAGQSHRAGLLAEDGDPGPSFLGVGAAPLGEVGGDGQGGPPGQPLDLEPGLARELAQDQGLGAGRLILGQRLEGLHDELGLGLGEGPSASSRPMPGSRIPSVQARLARFPAETGPMASAAAIS